MTDRRPLIFVGLLGALLLGIAILHQVAKPAASHASLTGNSLATTTSTGGGNQTSGTIDPAGTGRGGWQAGLTHINSVENMLFRNPDATTYDRLVDSIMAPACSCYLETKNKLARMVQNGQHVAGDNILISNATLSRQLAPNQFEIFLTIDSNGQPVVDQNNQVVDPSPNVHKQPFLYILEKGSDNQWHLVDRHPPANTG